MAFTRAASRSITSAEANVVTVSQRVVPAKRPNGSVSYRECSATPDSGAGCAACNKRARTPPTNVAMQPWTCHTALPGPNNPGPDPTAIVLTHSGLPSFEPAKRYTPLNSLAYEPIRSAWIWARNRASSNPQPSGHSFLETRVVDDTLPSDCREWRGFHHA